MLNAQDPAVKSHGIISGNVKDSVSGSPLEYATITLTDKLTRKVLNGSTTNNKGQFSIDKVAPGNFIITIESIGYKAMSITVTINKNENNDLKNILLLKDSKVLSTVTVTAQGKLIDNRIDKLVFNAERDLTSAGGVATDILKKVPQVSVDVDGNVELSGSSNIRFLINGKPSTAFGSSINDVLQSIPASQIKSIEVITNPGAKYDAQGLGGIINIILKQNTAKGINGNISVTTGTRMENGSFNFNARKGTFGINAFVSGNKRLYATTPFTSSRVSADTTNGGKALLDLDGTNRFTRYGIESGLGFDWTLRKKNSFTGTFNYNTFGNNGNGDLTQSQSVIDNTGTALSNVLSSNHSNNTSRFKNADVSFAYKRTFDKEDQQLDVSVNSSSGNSRTVANNEQFLLPADSLYYGIKAVNPGKENETQIALDYTQPLAKDVLLGVGGKTTFLNIVSSSDVLSLKDNSYFPDTSLSNNLNYHQKVYAGYAEISFPVSNWFDVKAGTRYERTEINSYYSNAQNQSPPSGYNTWVPSIFFSKKLEHDQVVKISYSKRIERPDYGDLNPFINTSDPKNITAGNPYLQPEIGQRYELSYSRDFPKLGSFMITAFYRNNKDDIQPYTKYYSSIQLGDSVYHNVSVSTRENIGTEKNTGVNLFANIRGTSKLSIRSNIFLFHRHITNAIDKGADRSSFNYRMNVNATYQFSPLIAGEFFGNFNSARNEVQGKYPSFTSYSFAIRKLFWNKKGSLAFTATNPFAKYVNQQLELYGTNFTQTYLRRIPFRSIGINFTWKFGKLEFKKEREDNSGDTGSPQ
ncbi:MAG: outer membrane beta-barrel family protein [Bacteroidota bacterium]